MSHLRLFFGERSGKNRISHRQTAFFWTKIWSMSCDEQEVLGGGSVMYKWITKKKKKKSIHYKRSENKQKNQKKQRWIWLKSLQDLLKCTSQNRIRSRLAVFPAPLLWNKLEEKLISSQLGIQFLTGEENKHMLWIKMKPAVSTTCQTSPSSLLLPYIRWILNHEE